MTRTYLQKELQKSRPTRAEKMDMDRSIIVFDHDGTAEQDIKLQTCFATGSATVARALTNVRIKKDESTIKAEQDDEWLKRNQMISRQRSMWELHLFPMAHVINPTKIPNLIHLPNIKKLSSVMDILKNGQRSEDWKDWEFVGDRWIGWFVGELVMGDEGAFKIKANTRATKQTIASIFTCNATFYDFGVRWGWDKLVPEIDREERGKGRVADTVEAFFYACVVEGRRNAKFRFEFEAWVESLYSESVWPCLNRVRKSENPVGYFQVNTNPNCKKRFKTGTNVTDQANNSNPVASSRKRKDRASPSDSERTRVESSEDYDSNRHPKRIKFDGAGTSPATAIEIDDDAE